MGELMGVNSTTAEAIGKEHGGGGGKQHFWSAAQHHDYPWGNLL